MRDIIEEIQRLRRSGQPVAIARVVAVEGSSPREPGAAMAVSAGGEVAGSVSGGCVEGAVVTAGLDLMERGASPDVHTYGIADEDAFEVGLTCGGTLHIVVQSLEDFGVYDDLREELEADRACVLATVTAGAGLGAGLLVRPDGTTTGTTGDRMLDATLLEEATALFDRPDRRVHHRELQGERRETVSVFLELFAPAPRLIVFGAVDFAAALVRVGKLLGYHVTICDARAVFASERRFPDADLLAVEWPDVHLERVGPLLTAGDAVCVLTHDVKFDVPAIMGALATEVGYIGALGSRRTTEDRNRRLLQAGATESDLERLNAPIGLDIGARTPEETAVAIAAEIVLSRRGVRPPVPLRESAGPIHHAAVSH
jgi:xanthine dehydrogenase accessory factor